MYNTDFGSGIRVVAVAAEAFRPAGYAVEIHFYNKQDAVKCASEFIRVAQENNQ